MRVVDQSGFHQAGFRQLGSSGGVEGAGGAPTNATYLTRTANATLSAESNLGALTTGLLKITVATGTATPSTAVAGTDYVAPGQQSTDGFFSSVGLFASPGGVHTVLNIKGVQAAAAGEIKMGGPFSSNYRGCVYVADGGGDYVSINRNPASVAEKSSYPFALGSRMKHVPSGPSVVSAAATSLWGYTMDAGQITLLNGVAITSGYVGGLNLEPQTIYSLSATTVAKAATLRIGGAPVADGGVTLTDTYALWIDDGAARFDGGIGGYATGANGAAGFGFEVNRSSGRGYVFVDVETTMASATSMSWYGINIGESSILTVTGSTDVTTASGVNHVTFDQPTMTAASALAISYGANVYIAGGYNVTGSATLTNNYALWVDEGLVRLDGDGTHVAELPADATGNATAAVGRIPVKVAGSTRYLRYYAD